MANEIQTKFDVVAAVAITLSNLASGAARQGTFIANATRRGAAKVTVKITSDAAAAPFASSTYEVWLLRGDGTSRDDGCGAADAAYPAPPTLPANATLIGTLVLTADTSQAFIGTFDTSSAGPLGPTWSIAIANRSGNKLNANGALSYVNYEYYLPEIQ